MLGLAQARSLCKVVGKTVWLKIVISITQWDWSISGVIICGNYNDESRTINLHKCDICICKVIVISYIGNNRLRYWTTLINVVDPLALICTMHMKITKLSCYPHHFFTTSYSCRFSSWSAAVICSFCLFCFILNIVLLDIESPMIVCVTQLFNSV